MTTALSPNAQVILLLTAPLAAGRGESSGNLLSAGEYNRLARLLREQQCQPSDLLEAHGAALIKQFRTAFDEARLEHLLARGFLLSQAIERWRSRSIWVATRADIEYPKHLKTRLREEAPPTLYGCGAVHLVETGALAIVGSRHVDEMLIQYTEEVGQLAGKAGQAVVSGGARGVDQAAMRGALRAGGKAIGVLADSLERAALNRDNRDFLMDERLVLISPYDPAAGFNVGHAMQRNKLIYALAEAALVVNSDFESGGTWAGAVEQLQRWHFVPIYVRSDGVANKALDALLRKGALPWPNPRTPEALAEALSTGRRSADGMLQQPQLAGIEGEEAKPAEHLTQRPPIVSEAATLAEQLFARVRELLSRLDAPKTETEIAADLQVSKSQARQWLQRLVREGTLEKVPKPTRYRSPSTTERLL